MGRSRPGSGPVLGHKDAAGYLGGLFAVQLPAAQQIDDRQAVGAEPFLTIPDIALRPVSLVRTHRGGRRTVSGASTISSATRASASVIAGRPERHGGPGELSVYALH
jgi:hypothetical protein